MNLITLPISPRKISPEGELLGLTFPRFYEKIGVGNHGSIFRGVLDNQPVCFKAYNSLLVRLLTNPARSEFEALSQAQSDLYPLREHIQQGVGWYQHRGIGPVLVTRLVADFDGQPSKSLLHTATITSEYMSKLTELVTLFPKYNLFFHATLANILVQRVSPFENRPVLIDLANYQREWRYIGHAIKSSVSSSARIQRIQRWADNTLQLAARKVGAPICDNSSICDLRLPSLDPKQA